MSQEAEGTIATAEAEEVWALKGRLRPLLPDGGNASEVCCVPDKSPGGVRGQSAYRHPESVEGIAMEVDPF